VMRKKGKKAAALRMAFLPFPSNLYQPDKFYYLILLLKICTDFPLFHLPGVQCDIPSVPVEGDKKNVDSKSALSKDH
jgi:hypothetical protein